MLKSLTYIAIFICGVKLVFVSAACGCGLNEVYDTCIAPCPARRCDVDERLIRCPSPPQSGDPNCTAGCRCADKFYKNDKNVCVPRNKCPLQCGENEIPTSCFEAICERRSCFDIGKPIRCVRIDPRFCTNGCLCKQGYLRDENGICIPIDHCPNIQCGKNEIFDVCPPQCPGENCGVDPSVILCLPNPQPGDPDCNPGCRCQDNYFRNYFGLCVPRDQCQVCGENEMPTSCFEAICEHRNCSDLGKPIRCMRIDPRFCTNGCLCKEGYLRDENGICIPINQCPSTQVCGKNEIPTSCFEGICERRSCSDLGKPIICVRIDPHFCTNGCLCKEGYLRDENGICIPINQCPNIQCGKNEIFDVCPPQCPGENCGVDPSVILCLPNPQPGDPDCNPGCRCQDNYFRNDFGFCVPKDQCQVCGANEMPTSCFEAICELRSCSDLGMPIRCVRIDPRFCTNGCLCKEGYLRDENGNCIPINQCPNTQVCGENEMPTLCFEAICELRSCSDLGMPIRCVRIDPRFCTNGCLCKEGYLRDENGICIPINQCPNTQVCGKNEIPTSCFEAICELRSCSDLGEPIACVRLDPRYCTNGCLCKEGYLRDENGICIPIDQCSSTQVCGENEIATSCFEAICELRSCSDLGEPITCVRIDPLYCTNGCLCKEGYLRDENGICVPIDQCPNIVCAENEISTPCFEANCERKSCSDLGEPIRCERLDPRYCTDGCLCKQGYLRDENGICIPIDLCPNIQCGTNEIFDVCPPQCPGENCGVDPSVTLCLPNPQPGDPDCNPGCRCQDNFFRDDFGFCVPRDQCPPNQCGENEQFDSCPVCSEQCSNASPDGRRCRFVGRIGITVKCQPACRCIDNYWRNDDNKCVLYDECPGKEPVICGPDEVYSSCINGGCERRNCSQPANSCILVDEGGCRGGCQCRDGLLRADNGVCIPADQCPPKPIVCGPDEVYNECVNGGCGRWNCSQPGIICLNLIEGACRGGCRCKEGLLRADDGTCIPADQCPINCFGQNEIRGCSLTCPPQTCESIGETYSCPAQTKECKPECRCKEGFFRNKIGECISKENCLKCTGPNEYFSCGGACDNVCATLSTKNQTNCPIVNVVCNPMCYCEQGYARDNNNICVPISECPQPTCGKNEVFDDCPATCPPETCDALGRAYKCVPPPKPGDPECKPSCRCADGYYRNKQGVCVPQNECLNCFGQNEVSGCQSTCSPQTCESIGKKYECPLQTTICKPECRCKEGFFRNKIGECISKENCLKCTGPNEYFSCGGACDNVCATLSSKNQTNCPIVNVKCNPMCYCEQGYARDNNNTCVPISECPQPACGKNEIFDICPVSCPSRTCNVLGLRDYKCPPPPKPGDPECKPSCRCADGYYRNTQGVCVPKNECPKPVVCRTDEVYNECVNGGCGRWNCSQPGPICIDLIEGACREGCRCKEGLLRADDGTCIPADQCPLNCFGQNEVSGCQSTCPQTCESIGKKYECPLQSAVCKPECRCKEGFFRNKIGECISKENCLKCTGPNEYFSCGGACDNVCATLSSKNQTNCPIKNVVCNPMCYCEQGYARDNNNTCVPISECPQPTCGKNEIFDICPVSCPPRTCDALGRDYKCLPPPKPGDPECKPSCHCADGYYRNTQGVCIPKNECPLKCGINEVYDICPTICPPQSCDFDPRVSLCAPNPKPGDPRCKPKCRCIDNYLRNKLNQCIPIEQCENHFNDPSNELQDFEQGNVVFTLKFLYEAAKANPGVSLIFSPYSVLFLLAQLALYATGTLLEQLLSILNLNTQPMIRDIIPNYLDTLGSQQNVTFNMVEKVYGNIQFPFSSGFERDTREIFKAEAQNLDFCKPDEAASTINAWVEQNTNNLIKNLVPPSSIGCDTVLALVNAIYFKGVWKDKFNLEYTREQDFYVDKDKTVKVNMMSRTGSYKYAEINNLDAQVIELPYKSDNFSFMIWLPKSKDGINNMIDGISDSNFSFSNIFTNLRTRKIDLSMPVFNTSTTTDLKQMLIKANVPALFDPQTSSFTGILQNPKNIYVSSGTQKATVIVNESGSEAAAANAVIVGVTSVQQTTKFIANHPFIYFILFKGTPIFCGIYFANV